MRKIPFYQFYELFFIKMKTQIINYYISEKQWSTNGLWIAIAVVALSVILWRTAAMHSLQRGLSYALAVAGLLFIIATGLTIRHNNRRITEAKQIAGKNELALKHQETARMENVIKNAYKVGLISFSIALVIGIVLFLIFKTSFNKGIVLGVLFFGAYGLMMETLSMRQNQAYLKQVESYQDSADK